MPSRAERENRPDGTARDSLNEGQDVTRLEEIRTRTGGGSRPSGARSSNGKSRPAGKGRTRLANLAERTCQELRTLASKMKIPGRSHMNKKALVRAIQNARDK